MELRYFRDTDKREVAFVITEDGVPKTLIEVKLSAQDISPSLRYLRARLPKTQAFQIHLHGGKDFVSADGIAVMPAQKFLETLA